MAGTGKEMCGGRKRQSGQHFHAAVRASCRGATVGLGWPGGAKNAWVVATLRLHLHREDALLPPFLRPHSSRILIPSTDLAFVRDSPPTRRDSPQLALRKPSAMDLDECKLPAQTTNVDVALTIDLGITNSNECFEINLTRPSSGAGEPERIFSESFNPRFTYPIINEAESIVGYKDPRIELDFRANDMKPSLKIQFEAKLELKGVLPDEQQVDLENVFKDYFPACTSFST